MYHVYVLFNQNLRAIVCLCNCAILKLSIEYNNKQSRNVAWTPSDFGYYSILSLSSGYFSVEDMEVQICIHIFDGELSQLDSHFTLLICIRWLVCLFHEWYPISSNSRIKFKYSIYIFMFVRYSHFNLSLEKVY